MKLVVIIIIIIIIIINLLILLLLLLFLQDVSDEVKELITTGPPPVEESPVRTRTEKNTCNVYSCLHWNRIRKIVIKDKSKKTLLDLKLGAFGAVYMKRIFDSLQTCIIMQYFQVKDGASFWYCAYMYLLHILKWSEKPWFLKNGTSVLGGIPLSEIWWLTWFVY